MQDCAEPEALRIHDWNPEEIIGNSGSKIYKNQNVNGNILPGIAFTDAVRSDGTYSSL